MIGVLFSDRLKLVYRHIFISTSWENKIVYTHKLSEPILYHAHRIFTGKNTSFSAAALFYSKSADSQKNIFLLSRKNKNLHPDFRLWDGTSLAQGSRIYVSMHSAQTGQDLQWAVLHIRPKLILYVNTHAYAKVRTCLGNWQCVSFPHLWSAVCKL